MDTNGEGPVREPDDRLDNPFYMPAISPNADVKEKNKGRKKPDNGVRRRKPWDGIYDDYFRKDFFGEDY
ncbi:MAG: hypothetical protein LBL57_03780 [Tannerella sp.]|jgi:hypothetical protein|nr:hypothetical protein [Tannerella sp.]